jgi:hypothetical protein
MTITSAISAILIGIVVGVVGRRLVPGEQPIGMLLAVPGRALRHQTGDPVPARWSLSHLSPQHPPPAGVMPVAVFRWPGAQRRLPDAAALSDQQCGSRCATTTSPAP